jgi:putative glutathione S-transferase
MSDDGEFDRQETVFRNWIRDEPDARFQPEAGRYHLYISRACPWAHGASLVRRLRGLDGAITMDVVDPYREEEGWQFTPEKDDCTDDSVHGADYLGEVYEAADSSFDQRPTVPVLWDRTEGTIVNNESIEVMTMLNEAFDGNGVDLYPADLQDEVDGLVDDLYERVNNGVYRAGFATAQSAYDSAVAALFEALDHYDDLLADQRYLAGERLTLADLRLFATLVRFDEVYHTHFMCNHQLVREYEHLWPYLRDLYQTPGVAETVNMDHIKEHYYTTHPDVTPSRIVARGPDLDFEEPHDRAALAVSSPLAE